MAGDLELRELQRERPPGARLSRRRLAGAFAAGVLLVAALGLGTSIFDSGPTEADVEASYREGVDRGTAAGEAHWQAELERRWWVGYDRGSLEQTSIAYDLLIAVRDGFSWEAGVEAGKASPDLDPVEAYDEGWRAGYAAGWGSVTGETDVDAPEPSSEHRAALRAEWGGEP